VKFYSAPQKKGFIGGFIDNLKEEFNKNKEMRDSVSRFREEAKKLEDTDALKDVRKKYKVLGDETDKSSKILKEKFDNFAEKVKEVINDCYKKKLIKN
jgi:mitochondrial import inner membrane translocase subunit TIM44